MVNKRERKRKEITSLYKMESKHQDTEPEKHNIIPFEQVDEINRNAWDIRRSDLRASWKLANDAERYSILNPYQKGVAESLRTLGYCLWRFGDYSQSLEKSLIAMEIFRSMDDKQGESDTLNSVGAVYMYQGDNENRLKCNLLCLQLRKDINDVDGITSSQNNIGETYMEMGNFVEAEKWFSSCLSNPNSSIPTKSWAFHNTGIIFFRKKEFEKAIAAYNKSLVLSQSVNYEVLSVSTNLHIAKALIESGVFSEEVDIYLNQALGAAAQSGIKEEVHLIYLTFSELEEKRGATAKAYEWFKKYHFAYENLFNESSNLKLTNIQSQYEIETIRKEAEFERTKHLAQKKLMEQIDVQRNEITKKNQEITDSIKYASRIQYATLTTQEYIQKNLPFGFFIFYKPKDIVSGDFYWSIRKEDKFYIAVCDSTGHGVPGAFMSLLNISYLNEAINEKNIIEPNLIFEYVRRRLIENLTQKEHQDGMDGVLLCVDYSTRKITYSASYNAPVIVRDNRIIKSAADKMPIGEGVKKEPFNNYELEVIKGDTVYLYTDGFADQFGGPQGKKFKYKQLRELMHSASQLPLNRQSEKFNAAFESWQGSLDQVDDVTCIGIRID